MGAADFINIIRNEVLKMNRNENTGLELATVVSSYPALAVRIDNMKLVLTSQDLIVCERLTRSNDTEPGVEDVLKKDNRVLVQALPGGQKYVIIDKVVE